MSSNPNNVPQPLADDVEEIKFEIIPASPQSSSTCFNCIGHVECLYNNPSIQPLPVPQVVLDALTALSPRKTGLKVDLPPISLSQFENYTMNEHFTPLAFPSTDTLLSPRSVDPKFRNLHHANDDDMSAMYGTPLKTS